MLLKVATCLVQGAFSLGVRMAGACAGGAVLGALGADVGQCCFTNSSTSMPCMAVKPSPKAFLKLLHALVVSPDSRAMMPMFRNT